MEHISIPTENDEPSGNAIYRLRRDSTFDDEVAVVLRIKSLSETVVAAQVISTMTIKTNQMIGRRLAVNTLSMTNTSNCN